MLNEYIYPVTIALLGGAAVLQLAGLKYLIRGIATKQTQALKEQWAVILGGVRQEFEKQKTAIRDIEKFQEVHCNHSDRINESVVRLTHNYKALHKIAEQKPGLAIQDVRQIVSSEMVALKEMVESMEEQIAELKRTDQAPPDSSPAPTIGTTAQSQQQKPVPPTQSTVRPRGRLTPEFRDLLAKAPKGALLEQAQEVLDGKLSPKRFAKNVCSAVMDQKESTMTKLTRGLSELVGKQAVVPPLRAKANYYKDRFDIIRIGNNHPQLSFAIKAAAEKQRKARALGANQVLFIMCPAFVSSDGQVSSKGILVTT